MTRLPNTLFTLVACLLCGLMTPDAAAEEPPSSRAKLSSPDPFQTAPGNAAADAAPKKDEPPVARTDTGLPVSVIAVLEMRDVYERSRGYQDELKQLRLKSKEPNPEVQKIETELKELGAFPARHGL